MSTENLIRRAQDPGYIIAWKLKYEFETGKFTEETMTYGEARKKCEELNLENPDKTYWPEKQRPTQWHPLAPIGSVPRTTREIAFKPPLPLGPGV